MPDGGAGSGGGNPGSRSMKCIESVFESKVIESSQYRKLRECGLTSDAVNCLLEGKTNTAVYNLPLLIDYCTQSKVE